MAPTVQPVLPRLQQFHCVLFVKQSCHFGLKIIISIEQKFQFFVSKHIISVIVNILIADQNSDT